MPKPFSCPMCNASFLVPDNSAGKKVRCPKCQEIVAVPKDNIVPEQLPEPVPVESLFGDAPAPLSATEPSPLSATQPSPLSATEPFPQTPPASATNPVEEALMWTRDARPATASKEKRIMQTQSQSSSRPIKIEPQFKNIAGGLGWIRLQLFLLGGLATAIMALYMYSLYQPQFLLQPLPGWLPEQAVKFMDVKTVSDLAWRLSGYLLLFTMLLELIGRLRCSVSPRNLTGHNLCSGALLMTLLYCIGSLLVSSTWLQFEQAGGGDPRVELSWILGHTLRAVSFIIGQTWFVMFLIQIGQHLKEEHLEKRMIRFVMFIGWLILGMVIATYSLIVYLTNAQLEGRLSQQIITIYWGAAGWLTAVLLLGGYHQTLGQFQREIRERLDAS